MDFQGIKFVFDFCLPLNKRDQDDKQNALEMCTIPY